MSVQVIQTCTAVRLVPAAELSVSSIGSRPDPVTQEHSAPQSRTANISVGSCEPGAAQCIRTCAFSAVQKEMEASASRGTIHPSHGVSRSSSRKPCLSGVGVQAKSLGAGIVMIAGPARQQPEILSAKAASRCRCVDTKDGTDRSPAKGARHQDRAKAAAARIGWSGRSISFVRPVYVDRVVQPVAHKSCGHDRIRATDWLAGRILGRAVQITATDAARRGRCQCWADGLEVRRARS